MTKTMQLNTGQTGGPAGRDINVVPAWMQGFTGKGVVVAVVDDGKAIINCKWSSIIADFCLYPQE